MDIRTPKRNFEFSLPLDEACFLHSAKARPECERACWLVGLFPYWLA